MKGQQLPQAFLEKMERLLSDEFDAFLASYDDPRVYGLRVNTLKLEKETFAEMAPFTLSQVAWADEGFYYGEDDRPGKHPYYHAGLYYIQEPSAMLPAQLLHVRPGERVLDLCAAPGGKSTQIAAKLEGHGVLVVNDIHSDRVRALVKNIELFGVRNAVVLNERPERLMKVFPGYFDKILIDAPCSGEGMFRKEEDMAKQWERHSALVCSVMQHDLLRQAAAMLAPGGEIVYSTCTFSPEEDEIQIAAFLDDHPDFDVVDVLGEDERLRAAGLATGRPDWACGAASDRAAEAVRRTVRLWPHRLKGEGHYAAVLRRTAAPAGEAAGETAAADAVAAAAHRPARPQDARRARERGGPRREAADYSPLRAWAAAELRFPLPEAGKLVAYGERVYAQPEGLPDLDGVKVARPGWHLGSLKNGRFAPSHALALGLRAADAARVLDLPANDTRAIRYLKGETLEVTADELRLTPGSSTATSGQSAPSGSTALSPKGWCLVTVDGFPVGWGKWQDGMLKNEYPQGWRWT